MRRHRGCIPCYPNSGGWKQHICTEGASCELTGTITLVDCITSPRGSTRGYLTKNWINVCNENSVKMKDSHSVSLPKEIQDYLNLKEAKQKKARENAVKAIQHRDCADDRTAAAL